MRQISSNRTLETRKGDLRISPYVVAEEAKVAVEIPEVRPVPTVEQGGFGREPGKPPSRRAALFTHPPGPPPR